MARKIIHLDLDAFFCSVEERLNPALHGMSFAVGGRPESRGVVASCSYAARMKGVHSAMPMSRAIQLCPGLLVIPGRHDVYSSYSQQVMAQFHQLTPLVEQISIDEAFLDVSDLPESGFEIAKKLQEAIHKVPGLPCSLGVAANKLTAKIATDVGKAANRGPNPPNAIRVVPPGEEKSFLAPLPVNALWGVGPKTTDRLASLGIKTIGDLADLPETRLISWFGKNGRDLSRHARGIDDSPVSPAHETKSISQETTFERDVDDGDKLRQTLRGLSDHVGRRLREENLVASSIKIKLRWPDFTTLTRQKTLPQPVDQDNVIYTAALNLFETEWAKGKSIRLLGVGASGLSTPIRQLSLWDTPNEKEHRLLEAVDDLRSRYGNSIIQRGGTRGFSHELQSHASSQRHGPILNSYWVIPGRFLAGPYPLTSRDAEERQHFRLLLQSGIHTFINLTEPGEYNLPLYHSFLEEEGKSVSPSIQLYHRNFPIHDRSIPTIKVMQKILELVEATLADGSNLYLHCIGGRGRTGTVVGCYLVNHGYEGHAALDQIQAWRKNLPAGDYPSPETEDQVNMVLKWGGKIDIVAG